MHPYTDELLTHLATQRAVLRAAYDATPIALRERRPAADRWSIAGVVEHLAVVKRGVAALLGRGLRAAQAEGSLPPLRGPDPALSSIDPEPILDRERAYQALEALQPNRGLTAEVAWRELEQADARFHELLTAADGLDTTAIQAPHPVFGVLTLAQWTVFLGYHEARHAAQIRRTADDLQRTA